MSITARFVGGPLDGQVHALSQPLSGYCVPGYFFTDPQPSVDPLFDGSIGVYGPNHEAITYVMAGMETQTGYYIYRLAGDNGQFLVNALSTAPVIDRIEREPVTTSYDEGPGMLLEELLGEIDDCLAE